METAGGRTSSRAPIRVAVVGCGAIAEMHLLALQAVEGAKPTALFDLDASRAHRLRHQSCPEVHVCRSLAEIADMADLAIVATPNIAHEETTCALLERGVNVLCEKPLASSLRAADRMIETARTSGRLLATGHVRRFSPQMILLRETLESGLLGDVTAVRVWECVKWYWSRATFDRAASGGGVLIDTGPHVLDLLMNSLGPLDLVDYADDDAGGVEAYAWVRLLARTEGQAVPVEIRLSRGEWGVSRATFECERGSVSIEPHVGDSAHLFLRGPQRSLETTLKRSGPNPYVAQLRNVVGTLQGRETLAVSGTDALAGVRLLSECYERRRPLFAGWRDSGDIAVGDNLAGARVLVTGATGRIGSRLVEMWAAAGQLGRLRCLVRSYGNAARLMRYPADVVEGDLLDAAAVKRAVKGCDAIVHLGAGEDAAAETRHIAQEALAQGVRRFVHMSTAVVYGLGLPLAVEAHQEETPVRRTGELYADGKAAAEHVLAGLARRGLHVVILRPQVVYGPEMRWSGELMRLLVEGRVSVVEGGGVCNLVYVDDLVRAIGLALVAECRPGTPFFGPDGHPRSWADYIDAHARLVGLVAPRSLREQGERRSGLRASWRETVKHVGPLMATPEFRALITEGPLLRASVFRAYLALRNRVGMVASVAASARRARAGRSEGAPGFDPHWTRLQHSEARLSAQQAEKHLSFVPSFSFEEGLRRTSLWFGAVGLTPGGPLGRED